MFTLLFIPTHGQTVEKPTPLKAINLDIAHLIPIAKKPDYDQRVLVPLHEAQREGAEKARVEAARIAEQRRVVQLTIARANVVVAASVMPTGSHTDWMRAAGIAESDFGYVEFIISSESGWRWWATNNEGSGAMGLGQALPASKMAVFGADYLTNPVTQLKWAQNYAVARYGSWASAYQFWVVHKYW